MKHTAIFVLLCAAAFAQDASVNTIATVGYLYPAPVTVAPGQVVTVFVSGNLQGDVTATVRQVTDHPAPVLSVRPAANCIIAPQQPCSATTAVTIQIPFEILPTCFVCAIPASFYTQLFVSQGGDPGALFDVTPLTDHIHFLTTCDTVIGSGSGFQPISGLPCAPYITHADGSLVTATSPAHGDEELVAYAVGLGATNPAVPTGQAAAAATPAQQSFLLDFNYRANALPTQPVRQLVDLLDKYAVPLFAGLTSGYVGLYQVNFLVQPPPAVLASCQPPVQSNLTVSMAGQYSFDGAGICVVP